jgi:hypothetical protein
MFARVATTMFVVDARLWLWLLSLIVHPQCLTHPPHPSILAIVFHSMNPRPMQQTFLPTLPCCLPKLAMLFLCQVHLVFRIAAANVGERRRRLKWGDGFGWIVLNRRPCVQRRGQTQPRRTILC